MAPVWVHVQAAPYLKSRLSHVTRYLTSRLAFQISKDWVALINCQLEHTSCQSGKCVAVSVPESAYFKFKLLGKNVLKSNWMCAITADAVLAFPQETRMAGIWLDPVKIVWHQRLCLYSNFQFMKTVSDRIIREFSGLYSKQLKSGLSVTIKLIKIHLTIFLSVGKNLKFLFRLSSLCFINCYCTMLG